MGDTDTPGVRRRRSRGLAAAAASLAGACAVSLIASPAGSQSTASAGPPDLQAEIRKRDEIIADLLRRVEALERGARPAAAAPPGAAVAAAAAVSAQAAQEAAPQTEAQTEARAEAPVGPQQPAPAPVQTAQAAPPPPRAPGQAPAAGQFEVDEAAAERALERTLVRTGALLLPPGSVELEPGFQYSRVEFSAPAFIQDGADQFVGLQRIDRDISDINLVARFGLPWDMQLDLSVPYRFEQESQIVSVNFSSLQEIERDADGFGDLGVGLSKGLLHEKGWRPDLIGVVSWDTTTGGGSGDFRFGSDFDELTVGLTAVKRSEPLVWVGTLAWQNTFEDNDIDPGDQWKLTLGAVLAVSPTTSMRFTLDQAFIEDAKLRGVKIPGSDTNASSLVIGASQVLSRRVLLDLQAGVGLTDAAPDYYVSLAFPIRFDSLF